MLEISHYGVVHVCFIIVLLVSRKRKELHEYILITWLIFLSLPLLSRSFAEDMWDISFPLFKMHFIYPLTFGPFLWLYIKSLLGDLTHFDKRSVGHFLPFIVITSYQLFLNQNFTPAGENQNQTLPFFDQFIILINFISISYYSLISILRVKQHSLQVLGHFSDLSTEVTLKWLYWIITWFLGTYYLGSILSFFSVVALTHSFALTIFVFMLSFFSLKQTSLFKEMQTQPQQRLINKAKNTIANNVVQVDTCLIENKNEQPHSQNITECKDSPKLVTNSSITKNNKYERSGLTDNKSLTYLKKLEAYMQTDKPYLDPDLTIEKLSKKIAIPRHYLTQVINEKLNKNFYLFINEYRIDAVKTLLQDKQNRSKNMLEIAYMSGFNSKSTFNVAFKKLTDMTPSQYKKVFKQTQQN